ncbi:MAG: tRNA pseudouridine(55) synthase TruB [Planctomycetes bacterium]|nr:tRNA pseudouridine(55) synthase TruB [Planctomycetota bacterium]
MGRRRRRKPGLEGVVLVDKPVGPTSREVVNQVGKALGLTSAGHTGTLDPLASGLLIIVAGSATRVQDLFMGSRKTYRAAVRLGARSLTDDAEGPIESLPGVAAVDRTRIDEVLVGFRGEILQRPPAFSAIRIAGQRAHELARAGEVVDIPERRVSIHAIEVLDFSWPTLEIEVTCGKGTFIRSLARDLGEQLGVGGYLQTLRRTRTGGHSVDAAKPPEALRQADVLDLDAALQHLPGLDLESRHLTDLLEGREVPLPSGEDPADDAIIRWEGRVIGRLRLRPERRFRLRRLIRDPRNFVVPD